MATTFTVSTSEELMSALASASGGDTIELEGGDYGKLSLIDGKTGFNVTFSNEVIIRSIDANQPASFSGMDLRGVSNLTFDGLVFDYEFKIDDSISIRPFQIGYGSSDVTIKNSVFDGDLATGKSEIDDGYGYGVGLSVRDSLNISIDSNEFFNWHRGAVYSQSENLSVVNNEVYAIRLDGLNFVEVKSVLIEGNYIHNFKDSPDSTSHRDMIQFWTNGTTSPTIDVVIRDNVLDIGEGSWTQSIFMRNEEVDQGRAGTEMNYQNILIENNTIYNGHAHGITVGETDSLTIRNNTVLKAAGDSSDLSGSISIPKINLASSTTSVLIQGNITGAINGVEGQSDWTVSGNALIQPSKYLEQFITSTMGAGNSVHGFIVLPNSEIEQLGAGSTGVQFSDSPDTLTPQFQVHSDISSGQTLIFDALLTVGPLGLVLESEAEFQWDFGDGNTAAGRIVKHDFASAGRHDVTLTVVAEDGSKTQAHFTAGIAGSDILQFDEQSGSFEALAYGEETALDGLVLPLLKTVDGYALKLGGEGTQATVAASEISKFFGTDVFELSMGLRADSGGSWGEIARVHKSFTASVDKSGNLVLDLFFADGSRTSVSSSGISINDGDHHDVTVQFDSNAGFVKIILDGIPVGSESVSVPLGGSPRSLDFGNPWGKQNFDGQLSAFTLSAESYDFPIFDGDTAVFNAASTVVPDFGEPKNDTSTVSPDSDKMEEVVPSDPSEADETNAGTSTDSELLPEEDSGALKPLLLEKYRLDFTNLLDSASIELHDDAHVVDTEDGPAFSFDGKKDYVSLGRLTEFENSQKIAFSVDFTSGSADGGAQRLVWNHLKVGLTLEGDRILVHANNVDSHFGKGFQIEALGLNDGNRHNIVVMADAESDRLQVVVDGVLMLDERDTDIDFVGAGGREWGWSLGTAWNRWFEGEVYDFQVSDVFQFVETQAMDGNVLT